MEGYCPYCYTLMEIGEYQETCSCPCCGVLLNPENLLTKLPNKKE